MGKDELGCPMEDMTGSKFFPFDVKWSSQLEKLADGLLICWQDAVKNAADPFGKVCVVVNDSATENWLKQYFLLDKKIPQVMMNLEFVKLPEFINDWLAAEVHGITPWQRQASKHPYSPDVLTWRIYNILSTAAPDGDLKELLEYIGEDRKHLRRLALSEKLAVLYDDYLNSRSQLLRNWEKGIVGTEKDLPLWQILLYQMLASEDSQTYAADYENAFAPGTDAKLAFDHGFPRYLAVHVFDIPFMPETTLHLLEKISEAFPEKMTFWHFNPHSDWLGDTDSKKETIRKLRKKICEDFWTQRDLLHNGENPSEANVASMPEDAYDFPEERLFGALASGARAMIYNLCNDSNGRVDAAGNQEALRELKTQQIFLHKCYSPRRELEAIKDGLLHFFKENKKVFPHDAVVLCADWENYAPIIESVFNSSSNSKGCIPITVAGKTAGENPFFQSFRELLAFRENRFEADAVFRLLEIPAIRKKYALDENALDVIRDMLRQANIRWGYDDADVCRILEIESDSAASAYPFTWQRGLDRMAAEFLYGFNEDDTILETNKIGKLRPCGFVEGDRAKILASLWQLVQDLKGLRDTFTPDRESAPDEVQKDLLAVMRQFYDESDETIFKEANRIRQTIRNTAENIKKAGIDRVYADVFLTSVLSALSASIPGMRQTGDSVLFAPLNCSNAVPHKLVWICGLNDGAFPKVNYRASYDLIGKHPSFFDTTSREKDAFALLKAVLSSRQQLCLSYVGMDNHSNDKLPPSVLLADLKDYFASAGISCTEYEHPMNGYSLEYFTMTPEKTLPPTYSASNYAIAEELNKKHDDNGIIPFPLSDNSVTDIELDKLMEFFSGPNRYLFSRTGIRIPESKYDQISSKECLEVQLDKKLQNALVLTGQYPSSAAVAQVETGHSPDQSSAQTEINSVLDTHNTTFSFKKNSSYNCDSLLVTEAFRQFEDLEKQEQITELKVNGHDIHLHHQYASLELPCDEGTHKFLIFYDLYSNEDNVKNKILLQHLAANAVGDGVATVLFGTSKRKTPVLLPELDAEDAKEMLAEIINVAGESLPPEFPDYRKTNPIDDTLPPEWQKKLEFLFKAAEEKK